jgi:hypothetical protein
LIPAINTKGIDQFLLSGINHREGANWKRLKKYKRRNNNAA